MILHLYHVAFLTVDAHLANKNLLQSILTRSSRLSLRASEIFCDNKVILDEIEQGNLECQTLHIHAEDFIYSFGVT